MTIDEAIKHCLEVAERNTQGLYDAIALGGQSPTQEEIANCEQCAADHRQLAEWLTELKDLRERIQKAKSMILDYSYTVEVMCNRIKNTMGCENCTYCNEETYECRVGAYISRTRAFVKGDGESESD